MSPARFDHPIRAAAQPTVIRDSVAADGSAAAGATGLAFWSRQALAPHGRRNPGAATGRVERRPRGRDKGAAIRVRILNRGALGRRGVVSRAIRRVRAEGRRDRAARGQGEPGRSPN